MNAHNIDEAFKQVIDDSGDYYSKIALESKAKVWESVQSKNRDKQNTIIRVLAAACITLLITTSFFLVSHLSKKNEINIYANNTDQLKKQLISTENHIERQRIQINNLQNIVPDTVIINTDRIKYQTVIETNTVFDTVYLEKIVYVEKALDSNFIEPDLLANEFSPDTVSYYTTIQINNLESSKKTEQERLFKINFGGNRGHDRSKSLALRSNF